MRIAHFTDLHVTADPSSMAWRDLRSKRLLGWFNLRLLGRHAGFREAPEVIQAFVRDLVAVRPDHIVSTGDLTGLALRSEFERARTALGPLLERTDVTGIPGNHDVYVRAAVRERLYESFFGGWTRTDFVPEDLPPELRPEYPYPLVRLLGDRVALVFLRDVSPTALYDSSGTVGPGQIHALRHILRDPRLAGRVRIVALHCGPCGPGGRPDRMFHGLRDADALAAVAMESGVALMIHGHIHRRFVVRHWRGSHVTVATPGSLTSLRHARAYHVYHVDGDRIAIEARRYDPVSRTFVPWPDAPGAGPIT